MSDMTDFQRLMRARISTRAFLDTPVSEDEIRDLLDTARWSASGGNLQPWNVHVIAGEARQAVIDAVRARLDEAPFEDESEFGAYPPKLWEPYRTRRFELGEQMYVLSMAEPTNQVLLNRRVCLMRM